MAVPLFYSNNADIKYPLSDFHEGDIRNDILLDLSLDIPTGLDPVLAAVRVGSTFVFISIEDRDTGTPIAHAIVNSPRTAVVVPLTMHVEGFGWVVFGPGVREPYFSSDIIDLDPECVTSLELTAPAFNLVVNNGEYTLANLLEIVGANETLSIRTSGQDVIFERNDELIPTEQIAAFTEGARSIGGEENPLLFELGGVLPDADGNIDVVVVGCIENCDDVWSLELPRGDTGIGESEELPLDVFNPKAPDPDDPCEGSGTSASSNSVEPFDEACQDIRRVTMQDPIDLHEIGTLYTV
jgi:hypothetical protein